MSKYELAVVVSAKIEDEERAAVIEKCKALIERFGGTVTNVDEWGKRKLAYEIQKMREAFYYFIQFEAETARSYHGASHEIFMRKTGRSVKESRINNE